MQAKSYLHKKFWEVLVQTTAWGRDAFFFIFALYLILGGKSEFYKPALRYFCRTLTEPEPHLSKSQRANRN